MTEPTFLHVAGQPIPAWTAAVTAAGLVLLVTLVRRQIPGANSSEKFVRRMETALTFTAAAIATAVSATGMWRVFGDALGLSGPARVAVFAFGEIALFTSAIRARRSLRETGSTGVDGGAVWVFAGLVAVLSALDSRNVVEVLLRLAAPLAAAWLWERGLAPERRQAGARRRVPVVWRLTRDRVLVWLRLADPAERGVAEVDHARTTARLVRAAWRFHTLPEGARLRRRWANGRLRRQAVCAVGRIGLGTDDNARDTVRRSLATLYGVAEGTRPAALLDLDPWVPPVPPVAPELATVAAAVVEGLETAPALPVVDVHPVALTPVPDLPAAVPPNLPERRARTALARTARRSTTTRPTTPRKRSIPEHIRLIMDGEGVSESTAWKRHKTRQEKQA